MPSMQQMQFTAYQLLTTHTIVFFGGGFVHGSVRPSRSIARLLHVPATANDIETWVPEGRLQKI